MGSRITRARRVHVRKIFADRFVFDVVGADRLRRHKWGRVMAQRFGGDFSPDKARSETGPETDHAPMARAPGKPQHSGRAGVLFFLPILFAINGLRGDPRALVLGLSAAAVLMLAAWLTREGQRAHAAYDERKVARKPAIPRKLFGAVLTGAALVIGGMMSQTGLLYPVFFGLAGAALHIGAFGLDPRSNKGMEGVDNFQVERVARAVDEAEALLAGMKDAILRAGDRALESRVENFAKVARGLFRTVEGDPGDLTAARKYLSVYLVGARDATVKFADAYARARDPKIRTDYESLLGDLETTFAQRTGSLLSGSHTDLDVEIQVLRDRLKLET